MLYCSGNLVAMFTPKVLSSVESRVILGSAKADFSGQIAAPLSRIGALRLFFNNMIMFTNRRTTQYLGVVLFFARFFFVAERGERGAEPTSGK